MYRNEYEYFKKELMRRKTYPYEFFDQKRAKEFFEKFKQEVPTARYYEVTGYGQFITHDRRAENRLCSMLYKHIDKHKQAILTLSDAVTRVENGMYTKETQLREK